MSPEEVLACRTPHELFGPEAADRRALKRAYAALIRTYDPDGHPEVFSHIRSLYERARRGELGELEAPPQEAEEPPAERVRVAMEAGRPDEALKVLQEHDLDIRIDAPAVWFAAVASLIDSHTFRLPVDTLQSWLDATESAPPGVPDAMLERIELLANTGISYQQARQDPDASDAVLDMVARWGQGPRQLAEGWMELAQRLVDPQEAWDAFQHVKEHHPALWFPLVLMRNTVTREAHRYDQAPTPHPARRTMHSWLLLAAGTARILGTVGMVAASAAIPLGWTTHPWLLPGAALVAVAGALSLSTLRDPAGGYDRLQRRLTQVARDEVLFPDEALDRILPAGDDPPPDAMLLWQRDPTTLMYTLTAAHLERIEARTSAEAPS